jgi:hypothetical protein
MNEIEWNKDDILSILYYHPLSFNLSFNLSYYIQVDVWIQYSLNICVKCVYFLNVSDCEK